MTPHHAPAPVPAPRASGAPVGPATPGARVQPGPTEQARLRASLGAVLRRERARASLSQRRLAALAGCHARTVERLEVGQLRPTTALLAALAHALVVPAGYSPAGRRTAVLEVAALLEGAAGASLVVSTDGGERRRRRRLRKARLAANAAALPALRARHGRT
ncbi:helix-turn-helix domain-containing protein [Dactylosporangium sp. CA-152071]|uniref:helix-turn-helix domain-containing protein n=1 Tax=Dactylosporangium sp. CA-152071 TaxID=3239933 RepID=UPI003D8E46C4